MTRICYLILLTFINGCALKPEDASQMSMYQLCEKHYLSKNSTTRQVAFDTLSKRGDLAACYANGENIIRAHQASQAALSNLSNQLNNMSNQVNQQQQRPLQTFCNTYGNGPYANTHCWQQ